MANHSGNTLASGKFVAWLGGLLIALVAGEDLRIRQVIAHTAARAHAGLGLGLNLKTRWHAGHDPAANPRVE
jgi:hypothetical protein